MDTHITNIFIVDDNKIVLATLKQALENRFNSNVQVSTFQDGESCLEKLNQVTHVVILDYYLEGENGLEILKKIKEKNPDTQVIMLSSNEDVLLAIETFRQGAKDFIIKDRNAIGRVGKLIQNIVTAPIRILVREFGVSKFMAIFLMTFLTMAIVVSITLFML